MMGEVEHDVLTAAPVVDMHATDASELVDLEATTQPLLLLLLVTSNRSSE